MAFVETTSRPKVRQRAIAAAAETLPDAGTAVDRILAVLEDATDDEFLAGSGWYAVAGEIAQDIANVAGIDRRHGAGILAALSPNTGWTENIARAHEFAEEGWTVHFPDALGKASAIFEGDDPASVLGGRKVRSFFANIDRPNKGGAVTIDRHAVSIIFGRSLSDREAKILERIGVYTLCASFYRAAARRAGIAPQQLQAITWLAWRRAKGISDHHTETEEF